MHKELYDISWKVSEPEYRKHPALSQSILGKYERGGFKSLPTLFDEESSPSLTFGSLVDSMITGTKEDFDKRFIVAEFPKLEPKVTEAVEHLFKDYNDKYANIYDIPEDELKGTLDDIDFYKRVSDVKRFEKVLTQDCAKYYRLLRESKDKELINQSVYDTAKETANALRGSGATFHYFRENDGGSLKRYYQLKFKGVIDGVEYRGMLDLCIVDYDKKVIIPCDLKTSSSMEYDFWQSFIKWRYDIQARLYWRLLRMAMDNDEYFRDFKLLDFRFIVVCKDNRDPLVWVFEDTQKQGDLMYGRHLLRAPWTIGEELRHYLDDAPKVPDGINRSGLNHLCEYLNKYSV